MIIGIYNKQENEEIIECFGDYWHCNPKSYTSDYYHKRVHKTAVEIWKADKQRIDVLEELGYSVRIIWENK